MFDVGIPEIMVIAILAVFLFGPDKIPVLAKQAAQFLHKARLMARRTQQELRDELGPEFSDLSLRELDPRTLVKNQIKEALAELDAADTERLRQELAKPAEVSSIAETTGPTFSNIDLEAT